jgi:hypothetical protein
MDTLAIREKLVLPDVRRPDQMPSLPAWLALRVASFKMACQASKLDGKHRMVPTLPSGLILTPSEVAEIDPYLSALDALSAQTPNNGAEWAAATLVIVTELMLESPASQLNEAGAQATGEAFQEALEDLPWWAVKAARRRWRRGDAGVDSQGRQFDYHWRPAPAELRRIAWSEAWHLRSRSKSLRQLIEAEPLIEYSNEHLSGMLARLSGLSRSLKTI